MKKAIVLFVIMISLKAVARYEVPYAVAVTPWEEHLGNHRAVITISSFTDVASVNIPWRRRDADAAKKRLIIIDAAGDTVRNIYRVNIDREQATFFFQPVNNATKYFVYYMPWKGTRNNGWFDGDYWPIEKNAGEDWIAKHNLKSGGQDIQQAKVECIESRTAFDSFYPMEVIATEKETEALKAKSNNEYILFAEKRNFPIRMQDDLPYKWVKENTSDKLMDTACRNEYFTFQIAVFASTKTLENIHATYEKSGFNVTCFNLEGIDSKGNPFVKNVHVEQGKIQPLWFGVDVPVNALPGWHYMNVWITAANSGPQKVEVAFYVKKRILEDRGDSELWRHSRLRWLNSTMGIDDKVVAPYKPLQVQQHTITASTGTVTLNEAGLPATIKANNLAVLRRPVDFIIETDAGKEKLNTTPLQFTKKTGGKIAWESVASNDQMQVTCNGVMECDGYISYSFKTYFKKAITIKDIRLELPVKKKEAQYFMGMGLSGGLCPQTYNWKWKGPQDACWIGNTDAGLYCELRGASYMGPLLNLYHPAPPASWYNNNLGGFNISTSGDTVITSATSGERSVSAGDTLRFDFALLITPVKKINTRQQFLNRYYHNGKMPAPAESDLQSGIKIINVHHANTVNPYINYPFISTDSIKAFTTRWHQKGLKVKLYYTIRELSNQAAELWALRSLGDEVLADGNGGGYVWLREHLGNHYRPEWFANITGYGASDAAILTSGDSRWYNYYIEGLNWLVRNTGIDGLYLDDVAYDRNMLKRMRKVMDKARPGCIIDLHSNTGFSKGPATQYTEFFPYINKIWFGESFLYDKMPPENWIVEVSGIPFGLMGDMLHAGGNPWRGMVYGMTVRYPWYTEGINCDPRNIWKVWDGFGIADARMVGYWDKNKLVTTSDSSVLATAYVKNNKILIAVASWAREKVSVKIFVDWKKIGWQPAKRMIAPFIDKYQPAATFDINQPIEIEPGKGWLLVYDLDKDPVTQRDTGRKNWEK